MSKPFDGEYGIRAAIVVVSYNPNYLAALLVNIRPRWIYLRIMATDRWRVWFMMLLSLLPIWWPEGGWRCAGSYFVNRAMLKGQMRLKLTRSPGASMVS